MAKQFMLFFFLTFSVTAWAGKAHDYPVLEKTAATKEGFIPSDWMLLVYAEGDLNNDGYDDIAFVLESEKDYPHNDVEYFGQLETYRLRILGVALWDEALQRLVLSVQSDDFILTTEEDSTMEEPFRDMLVKEDGTLLFQFWYWCNGRALYMSDQTFIFRFQNKQFELIDYTSTASHYGLGEESKLKLNFVTGRGSHRHKVDEYAKAVTKWGAIEDKTVWTLDTIGNPFNFYAPDLNYDDE